MVLWPTRRVLQVDLPDPIGKCFATGSQDGMLPCAITGIGCDGVDGNSIRSNGIAASSETTSKTTCAVLLAAAESAQ
jgi:hypothetical protein